MGKEDRIGGVRRGGVGQEGWSRSEGQGCLPRILCHVTVSTMCISLRKKGGGLGLMTPMASETTKGGSQGSERVILPSVLHNQMEE